ncbi:glycosyltransferase [Paenibacillus woosongensis]|uniref:Glycosyltransferase n=1 Tax=Paenibacillus woosongensis TaxID=307580 RepID=A0A7X2Z527_9BACL|nr:glycosyltransferase [Paenibacillus woosongensis]MUG47153.1 glycosyltransferase [Paenibacillus woosongensis]
MDKVGLSLCMIVKNESENIVKAIKTAQTFVQEIIIVDTGSTDQTPELAQSLGAKVFKIEWNDHFGDMRNYSIQKATQPFILVMDADELIIDGDMSYLQECCRLISQQPGAAGTVIMTNETVQGDVSITSITRIFPNDRRYKYAGRIHEQLMFVGSPIKSTINTQIVISHTGYSDALIQGKNKLERNIQLLKKELQVSPDQSYILFQIGRTYYVMKDYVQAEYFLSKCVEIELSSSHRSFLAIALLTLGYCFIHLKKFNDFVRCYRKGIEYYPDYTDLYFMYGVGLIESRNISAFKEIPEAFKKCIELGDASDLKYETVRGVGSFKAHFNLGLYYEIIGDSTKAVYHYQQSSDFGNEEAKKRISQILK